MPSNEGSAFAAPLATPAADFGTAPPVVEETPIPVASAPVVNDPNRPLRRKK